MLVLPGVETPGYFQLPLWGTTLSPSFAFRDGAPYMAFGTPGGDAQDQWSFNFFLAHAAFGLNLQQAIDAPDYHNFTKMNPV